MRVRAVCVDQPRQMVERAQANQRQHCSRNDSDNGNTSKDAVGVAKLLDLGAGAVGAADDDGSVSDEAAEEHELAEEGGGSPVTVR